MVGLYATIAIKKGTREFQKSNSSFTRFVGSRCNSLHTNSLFCGQNSHEFRLEPINEVRRLPMKQKLIDELRFEMANRYIGQADNILKLIAIKRELSQLCTIDEFQKVVDTITLEIVDFLMEEYRNGKAREMRSKR